MRPARYAGEVTSRHARCGYPRRTRRRWSTGRLASIAMLAVSVLGCASVDPTDPAAPLIVHGVVHDIGERPVADATVSISVDGPSPDLETIPGRTIFELQIPVASDGTFQFRYRPTEVLVQTAAGTSGVVLLTVSARDSSGNDLGFWQFPRTIEGGTWTGDPPGVVIRPVNSGPDGCC
jgi:hypothetical protein